MKTLISALVALVVGAGGGYFYTKNDVNTLQAALDAAKEAVTMAEQKATESAGALTSAQAEAEASAKAMQDELAAAKQQAEDSLAKVSELEIRVQELEAAQQSNQ